MSEGLLIFTNDGETAHRLLHPSYEIPRRYRVEVEGAVGSAEARRLTSGIRLEDGLASAEDVTVEAPVKGSVGVIELTVREGRKREIRRMMEALGLTVRRLVRVAFGPVELDGITPGAWRELRPTEVQALTRVVGLNDSNGNS